MLLSLPELPDAWDALRGFGTLPRIPTGSSGPVLIFVSADTDSAAAVRTLTALLKADVVRYEVHPVSGYPHLVDVFDVLAKGDNAVAPRAVLCVNCGANVNLEKILGLSDMDAPPPVYVMDSHRPFHLKNIASDAVVLFDDDETFDHGALPLDVGWEDEWGNVSDHEFSDASDSDSSDSDASDSGSDDASDSGHSDDGRDSDASSEADAVNADPGSPGQNSHSERQREPSETSKLSKAGGADSDREDGSKSESVAKRPRAESGTTDAATEQRGSRRRAQKRRRSDESGEHSGTGARGSGRRRRRKRKSRQSDLESAEKEALREYYAHTSLAMSSACLSHNLASTLRRGSMDTLWMAIVGVTSQYLSAGVADDLYQDAVAYFRGQVAALAPVPAADSAGGGDASQEGGGYSAAACRELVAHRVAPSTELRLDLVRHWTLHDSLLYSSYTVTRLAAWRQTGRRRLLELLATLGIPLKESRQRWCFMKAECKAALDDRLAAVIRRFDLGRAIQYDSFVRSMPGHRGSVSAADVVFAISALLELDVDDRSDRAAATVGPLQERFWRAYDALDSSRGGALDTGLEMAIAAQKLSAEIGGDVIERRKFVPSGPFRYVFLRDQQCKDFLVRPLLLKRLALFLIDALARQGAKDKPFVVLAPDVARGVWLAVAATSVGRKNDFGVRFQKAAEKNGSQIVYCGFDSAVCEIQDGQEVEFVRFLHDVMR